MPRGIELGCSKEDSVLFRIEGPGRKSNVVSWCRRVICRSPTVRILRKDDADNHITRMMRKFVLLCEAGFFKVVFFLLARSTPQWLIFLEIHCNKGRRWLS